MEINLKIKKILHILSNNSRTTTKEIAKEIKTSQQNASYLIKKLEEEKIIHSYKVLIDSSKFGLNNFCVFLRLKKNSKSQINLLISSLTSHNEVTCIDILFGNFDIFIRFTTPNSSHFNKVFNEILSQNQNQILNYQILTQIVLYDFPHNFLSKKKFDTKIITSGDRKYISTNAQEQEILNQLNSNSKINFVKIANKLGVTSKTIISKVKYLESKKIIKGYSININHKKIEVNRYYLFLKFNLKDEIIEKKFREYIQKAPNTIEHIKVFGKWDSILIIETNKSEDFKKILFDIKEEFSEILGDYNFLESEEIKLWKNLPPFENNLT